MRDLKIEDLKPGTNVMRKACGDKKTITEVRKQLNKVYYENGYWDYIYGDLGMLNKYYLIEDTSGEVEEIIASRSNVTYNQISDDASAIIATLGTDEYAYFFGQIANKLARIKHGYSVEDSLLDIAGYAKLELDKFREGK